VFPRPPAYGEEAGCSLSKNSTPALALWASGCSPSGLSSPLPNYPYFEILSDATVLEAIRRLPYGKAQALMIYLQNLVN